MFQSRLSATWFGAFAIFDIPAGEVCRFKEKWPLVCDGEKCHKLCYDEKRSYTTLCWEDCPKLVCDGKSALYQFMRGNSPTPVCWESAKCQCMLECALYQLMIGKAPPQLIGNMPYNKVWWKRCSLPVNDGKSSLNDEKTALYRFWRDKCPIPFMPIPMPLYDGKGALYQSIMGTVPSLYQFMAKVHFTSLKMYGWEIAVILRNFRKTKLSKSKFFFFFFFNSISTYILCATRRLSLCDICKYHFPAFYGTSDRQAAIFFWTRMIQTWSSFSLMDPCSIFFCSSVKPKFFTPTHEDGKSALYQSVYGESALCQCMIGKESCTILWWEGCPKPVCDWNSALYQFGGKHALYKIMVGKVLFDGKHVVYQFMMGSIPCTGLWWEECPVPVYDGGSALYQFMMRRMPYTSLMRKMPCTSSWWLACPVPVYGGEKVPCIRLRWEKCPVPVCDGFSSDLPFVWFIYCHLCHQSLLRIL